MAFAIDTYAAVKKFEQAGLNAQQAEAVVEVINGAAGEQVTKKDLDQGLARCATKEDLEQGLARCATKEDLEQGLARCATKEDLRREMERFATKEDLARCATKEDLKQELARYATKEDLAMLRADIYRALWLQFGAIVAAMVAMLSIARVI